MTRIYTLWSIFTVESVAVLAYIVVDIMDGKI